MRKVVALALVAFVAAAASVAQAGPTPAQKCTAAKIKAASKKAAATLKCQQKAILKGIAVDQPCLDKAQNKFDEAFAKAEAKGGCATAGDAAAIGPVVDTFVDDLVAALEPPVSFAASVQPMFSANCATSGCHSGTFAAAGLDLGVGQAYANIVNVASTEQPLLKRVLPGDAASSYLYQKLTNAPGISGAPMPLGSFPLPADDLDVIEAWINQGALNN
jgi:hypothetical protein